MKEVKTNTVIPRVARNPIFVGLIMLFLFLQTTFAQEVWKYSDRNTFSSNWSDALQAYSLQLIGATSYTSYRFGPGVIGRSYNGLLGLVCEVDSQTAAVRIDRIPSKTGAADTLSYYLVYYAGDTTVVDPDVITWKNANDSTETTTQIIMPADHGKVWIFQTKPVSDYLGKFPFSTYGLKVTSTDSVSVYQKNMVVLLLTKGGSNARHI